MTNDCPSCGQRTYLATVPGGPVTCGACRDAERIAELEAEVERLRKYLDLANNTTDSAIEHGRKLLAQRDRLAEALRRIEGMFHADTCSRALIEDEDCDCHCRVARRALAELEGNDE